jgi:hypothetical protein
MGLMLSGLLLGIRSGVQQQGFHVCAVHGLAKAQVTTNDIRPLVITCSTASRYTLLSRQATTHLRVMCSCLHKSCTMMLPMPLADRADSTSNPSESIL